MPKPKYFEYFPEKEENFFGIKHLIKDLNRYIRVSPDILTSKYAFYDYVIKDGQRPDHVSYDVYGDSKYYWVILLANNIRDIWREWPLSQRQFHAYIVEKYGSISYANSAIHHYIANDGTTIDELTAQSRSSDTYSTISYYQYEDQLNEAKREIKIIQPRYLSDFQEEITNLFEEA